MNERELDRLLRSPAAAKAPCHPTANFADAILARLPGMRYVVPGSPPGLRFLLLAALLGLLTTIIISLLPGRSVEPAVSPPPSMLFQPGAVEPAPVLRPASHESSQ